MVIAERELRAAQSQMSFRSVNDRIRELDEKSGGSGAELDFTCECADDACLETIRLSAPEYDAIEHMENQFIVLRGHEVPEVENTIAEFEGFLELDDVLIVSKRGAGAEFVRENS